MNKKRILILFPLILYPYAYLFYILLILGMGMINGQLRGSMRTNFESAFIIICIGIFLLYNFGTLCIAINNAKYSASDSCTAIEASKTNLIIKSVQIPAYIFHFFIGILGVLMSVWGIGLIFIVLIIDFITITLTGISSIGCTVKMKNAGYISHTSAVLSGLGSFVYCFDIFIAIYYFSKAKKGQVLVKG